MRAQHLIAVASRQELVEKAIGAVRYGFVFPRGLKPVPFKNRHAQGFFNKFLEYRNADFVAGERDSQVLRGGVTHLARRQRVKFEEHKDIALRIVEGLETGDLFHRKVSMDDGESARVDDVPCGIPAGLTNCEIGCEVRNRSARCGRRVAHCGLVRNQSDLVSAD